MGEPGTPYFTAFDTRFSAARLSAARSQQPMTLPPCTCTRGPWAARVSAWTSFITSRMSTLSMLSRMFSPLWNAIVSSSSSTMPLMRCRFVSALAATVLILVGSLLGRMSSRPVMVALGGGRAGRG